MWLRDALPQHLSQARINARVFIYGYDSQLIESDSFQEITDLGREFKNKMVQLTQSSTLSATSRLIVLGHSLGGIIVKQVRLRSQESPAVLFYDLHIPGSYISAQDCVIVS